MLCKDGKRSQDLITIFYDNIMFNFFDGDLILSSCDDMNFILITIIATSSL